MAGRARPFDIVERTLLVAIHVSSCRVLTSDRALLAGALKPRKLPLGRTGSKHTKRQRVKEDSTEDFPVVNLDIEAAVDAGGTVEDVLDSLIGLIELAVAAWLQQHAKLHERQWLTLAG
jgi:hypothetical protein